MKKLKTTFIIAFGIVLFIGSPLARAEYGGLATSPGTLPAISASWQVANIVGNIANRNTLSAATVVKTSGYGTTYGAGVLDALNTGSGMGVGIVSSIAQVFNGGTPTDAFTITLTATPNLVPRILQSTAFTFTLLPNQQDLQPSAMLWNCQTTKGVANVDPRAIPLSQLINGSSTLYLNVLATSPLASCVTV